VQNFAAGSVFDDRTGRAIDNITAFRDEGYWLVLDLAGSAQRGTKFLLDTQRAVWRHKILGPLAEHFIARESQARKQRIVYIQIHAIFGNRGRHGRRFSE